MHRKKDREKETVSIQQEKNFIFVKLNIYNTINYNLQLYEI